MKAGIPFVLGVLIVLLAYGCAAKYPKGPTLPDCGSDDIFCINATTMPAFPGDPSARTKNPVAGSRLTVVVIGDPNTHGAIVLRSPVAASGNSATRCLGRWGSGTASHPEAAPTPADWENFVQLASLDLVMPTNGALSA